MKITSREVLCARGNPTKAIPACLISVIVVLMLLSSANAEERYSLLSNLKEDFTYAATSPSRMDKRSAIITLGLIGIGAILYTQDEKIRDYVQDHKTASLDGIFPLIEKFGNGIYDLGFLAVYGGSGYMTGNEKMRAVSLHSFESFLVANTIGTVAKIGIGRARPYTEEGRESYKPFSTDTAHTALPSGHTTSAFSIAAVFADEYDNPWVGVTAYGLASAVALERVYDDQHWASDVFAGAVLGIVAGKSIVYLHKRKETGSVYLVPLYPPGGQGVGVAAVLRF